MYNVRSIHYTRRRGNLKKTETHNGLKYILLIAILLLECAWAIFWCQQKKGFFVDEGFTYTLSNSYDTAFLEKTDDYIGVWHDSNYFKDAVTVQPGEEMAIGSVIKNQAEDVHPPLYYYVIHAICSMFPNQFSYSFGLIPNIIFFLLTNFFLYLLLKKVTDNDLVSLCGVVIYGFSFGAVANVLFIRMYMMLTLFTIVSVYIHYLYVIQPQKRALYQKIIFFLTIFGALTQFYFIVYQACIALVTIIWVWLKEKNLKQICDYMLMNILSAILYIFIWPYSIVQIFGNSEESSYRGQELYTLDTR